MQGGQAAGPADPALAGAAPRDTALTRLRFFLIGWVVLYHLDLALQVSAVVPGAEVPLRVGYLGVDGFFLLSGFALWLGYAGRPPRGVAGVGNFLLRRVSKIWPLHVAALLALGAIVGLAVALGQPIRDPDRFAPRDLLMQFLLVNAWETVSQHGWNYPSWALSAEWAGYLAFPLLLWAMLRLPRGLVPALAGLALGALLLLESRMPDVRLNWTIHLGLVRFFAEFLLGMALGRMAQEGRLSGAGWLLIGAGLAIVVGVVVRLDTLVVAGLAGLIAGLWLRGRSAPLRAATRPGLLSDLVLRLGEASFGVYLCWIFVEAGLVGLLRRTGELAPMGRIGLMVAGYLACLAAGWCAWRLVEVPAQRWILARARRGRPASVAASAA